MFFKSFKKFLILGTLSVGSFTAGSYSEGKEFINTYQTLKKIHLPAFPLFGTVSAASPLSPISSQINVSRVSQIMKYGFPGLDNVRSYDDFVLSYDRRNKVAHWVFEHLTAETIRHKDQVDRSKCDFKPDETIHEFFRFVSNIILSYCLNCLL